MLKVNLKLCFVLALCVVFFSVSANAEKYMLYTEKTLAQAGVVTPSVQKAHFYESGEVVELTAQPYQGFEFIYWLGDVEEKTARTTKVVMDSPRYVVAVFEASITGEGVESGMQSLEEGGGGVTDVGGVMTGNSITQTGSSGFGAYLKDSERPGTLAQPTGSSSPSPTYRPPNEINPNPVIPEPATLTLFGLGAAGVAARRIIRKRKVEV